MRVGRTYRFEAARKLLKLPSSHPCSRLHGHSFCLEVEISGELAKDTQWVMDYSDIDLQVAPLLTVVDHSFLNEIAGLGNPTTENLVLWFWERLHRVLPGLYEIRIRETADSVCAYNGPGRNGTKH